MRFRALALVLSVLCLFAVPALADEVVGEPAVVVDVIVITPTPDAGPTDDVVEEVADVVEDVPATEDAATTDAGAATPAPAPVVPSEDDPGAILEAAVLAAQTGRWSVFFGLAIMFLIWGLRKVLLNLDGKVVPWVALGAGILAHVGIALAGGAPVTVATLTHALLAGATAVGLWEMLFKHLLGKKE